MPQGAGDPVGRGAEAGQLDAPLDPRAPGGQAVAEDRFGLGLGHEQQEREGGVGQAEPEQPHPDGPAAGMQPEPHGVVAAGQQLPGHPQPAQDLQGPWLDGQGPGLVHPVRLAVHDPEGRPHRLQLPG
jgi:hypothetical protein